MKTKTASTWLWPLQSHNNRMYAANHDAIAETIGVRCAPNFRHAPPNLFLTVFKVCRHAKSRISSVVMLGFRGPANFIAEKAPLLSLFILSVSAIISAHAQRYLEISAELDTFTYQLGDTNHPARNHISVACITGTEMWRIENGFVRGAEQKYFFDGTNVYAGLQIKPAGQQTATHPAGFVRRVGPFVSSRSNNLTINIFPSIDGHPFDDVAVNIPWLAFCSGTYLKRSGRIIPLPDALLRHAPDATAYFDQTLTFDDGFGLPKVVDLFTSASLYKASRADFDRYYFVSSKGKRERTSGLPDGLLKFHYTVTDSTNFQGNNFPLRFEWLHYDSGKDGKWTPFYGGVGIVTSFRESGKPEGLFVPGMRQTIVDGRLGNAVKEFHSVTYESTNGYLTPTNDVALQEKLARRAASASLPMYDGSHSKPGLGKHGLEK